MSELSSANKYRKVGDEVEKQNVSLLDDFGFKIIRSLFGLVVLILIVAYIKPSLLIQELFVFDKVLVINYLIWLLMGGVLIFLGHMFCEFMLVVASLLVMVMKKWVKKK